MQRVRELLQSPEPIKWLFSGDSITHGAVHTFGGRDYTELFSERVRSELNRNRDFIIKVGVNGASSDELLDDFDWTIGQFRPDVAFIMLGMNDCSTDRDITPERFADNLQEITDRIKAFNGVPILQTTCICVPELAPTRGAYLPVYMDVVRSVAKSNDLPLIDHTLHWEERIKAQPGLRNYWLSDPFHPNAWGHQAFAELIFKELGIFDPNAASGRLFRP